ncbi:MAG: FHA domain-containing protein [Acidobacteriota bacterium]
MRRRALLAAALPLLLSGCALTRATIPSAYIDQIQADPTTFLGKPLLLEGSVQGIDDRPGGPRSYTLSDASGRSIEVRTSSLPRAGGRVRLYAQVAQNESNVLVPYLIETKHTDPDRPSVLTTAVLALIGIFFMFVLSLDVIGQLSLHRKRRTEYLPVLAENGAVPGGKKPPPPRRPAVPARPYAEGDRFRFSVIDGPDKGREIVVERHRVYLGRGDTRKNNVELLDATVSRKQAVLAWSRKRREVVLINQAHTNPTAINGSPVKKSPVHHGDVLKRGKTKLQVFFEATVRPASPDATPVDPTTLPSGPEPRHDATPLPSAHGS